ncbi:MAG: ferrochelatase [Pseudomonadota bacterium]
MGRKIAIVLFNLGGPNNRQAIRPFLKNLFSDPAIIRAPGPIRWALSELISRLRAPAVAENYAMMDAPGGGSPLLPETEKQAAALESALDARHPENTHKCFIAMRYWHPFTHEAAEAVAAWDADEIILLPLYPQFSSTTTGSSAKEWAEHSDLPVKTVCCYPLNDDLIIAHAQKIMSAWEENGSPDRVHLLMSAHGLPERVVKDGDPYQWQVEQMAAQLVPHLPDSWNTTVCYQSRVGPLKWIGPATEDVIEEASKAGEHIVVAPVAFVSDHIETLVELGEEYREVAEEFGAVGYINVPALGTIDVFIKALADEVDAALADDRSLRSCAGGRLCPKRWSDCPHAEPA